MSVLENYMWSNWELDESQDTSNAKMWGLQGNTNWIKHPLSIGGTQICIFFILATEYQKALGGWWVSRNLTYMEIWGYRRVWDQAAL